MTTLICSGLLGLLLSHLPTPNSTELTMALARSSFLWCALRRWTDCGTKRTRQQFCAPRGRLFGAPPHLTG